MAWGFVIAGAATVVGAAISSDNAAGAQREIADKGAAGADRQLDAQVKQADDLLAFNKQQYEEGKTRQVGVDAINKRVIEQNLALSEKAGQRADEAAEFYKQTGRPAIEQTLQDAKGFDSQGNIDAARGRAGADVQQGFDNADQQSQRALSRMGVNPSSGRFMQLQQRMQADKAAAMAVAGTGAEESRRQGAIGLRQQAGNLANGLPAQSLAQGAQSSQTGNSAAGVANMGAGQNSALTQQALSGMSAGAGIYGNAASGYSNLYGQANHAASSINAAAAQSQQGWGNLAGAAFSAYRGGGFGGSTYFGNGSTGSDFGGGSMYGAGGESNAVAGYANGGKVTGPGTGTSDSVPAVNTSTGGKVQLSNGEFVVSADVVRKLGTDHFEKLQQKYHTPVNLGRAHA